MRLKEIIFGLLLYMISYIYDIWHYHIYIYIYDICHYKLLTQLESTEKNCITKQYI